MNCISGCKELDKQWGSECEKWVRHSFAYTLLYEESEICQAIGRGRGQAMNAYIHACTHVGPQKSPRRGPGGSQEAQERPQRAPKGTQDGPKRAQNRPQRAQDRSKRGARRYGCETLWSGWPQDGPERPKEAPRRPPGGPQEGPRRPRWAQDGPQEGPRWPQDGPKMAQDRAKTASRSSRQQKMKRKR